MKKILTITLVCLLILSGCKKQETKPNETKEPEKKYLTKMEMNEVSYYAYNNDDESIRYYKINGIYQCNNQEMDCFYQEGEKNINEDGTINYTKIVTIQKEDTNEYYLKEVSDVIPNIDILTEVNEEIA